MRTNLPVTGVEVVLADDALIVSKTDLKGQITYINADFLKYSGFSESELLGQPHNLVRHPDMPPEAFKDMWDTLKEGRPWTGYVKNRCKNGDHYWVLANATPIWEQGQLAGYLSARRKPSRDMVSAHEEVYRQFREKRQGSLKISYGKAVKGNGGLFGNMSLGAKLNALMAGIALTVVTLFAFAIFVMSGLNDATTELYERRFEPAQIIGRIGKLMSENQTQANALVMHDPAGPAVRFHDHPATAHTEAIEKNVAEVTQLWKEYEKHIRSDDHRKLADEYTEARRVFAQEGLLLITKNVQEGNYPEATRLAVTKLRPAYAAASSKATELLSRHAEKAAAEQKMANERFQTTRIVSLGILLLVILLGYVISARFIRSIRRPLEDAVDTMRNITQGNYSNVVDIARNDELGKTLQGLQMLQTRMGYEVVEAKRTADEMTRVKIALDNVSTGVMIADAGRNIIYTNHSVLRILKGAESGIRQILPNFDADNLMGKNIDIFHKNPSHQANLLATLNKTHAAKLEVGGRHLTVTASPVLNDRGERLGSVAEWLDRTDEVMVEKEVESIVYAAAQGDFSRRLALEGKTGFFLSLANGLNTLLETSATGLEEVADVLGSLAQGDLTRQVGGDYQGTFGQLKDDTNLTINQLKNIIQSIQESSELINTAAKEIAAGNTDLSSRTEEQASSLEETASSMEQLSSTVKQNAANAGDAHRVTEASRQAVEDGSLVFHKVVETMKDIHASSSKITDIIGVIDGIAFQTNILALNAAVEAARAGEQGRGFAVVATEVRSLAQRSAAAAKEIKTLIEASSSKVDEGTHLVSDASKAMESVRDSIMRVTRLVGDIASASVEQSAGIGQVSLAVSQMDEVTQQNAALVEEAAAAAESLEDQAQTLNEAVSVFRVDAGSNSGGRGVSASKSAPSHRPSASRAPVARSSTSTRSSAPSSSRSSPLPSDEGDEWAEF